MDTGRGQRRVTAFDVAEIAGVSQSTVSRVLSGGKRSTEDVRRRVEEAARHLGYVVNEHASRLRKGTTCTIALVLVRSSDDMTSSGNPLHFELLGLVCDAAAMRGYDTLVSFQSVEYGLFGQYYQQGKAEGTIVIGSPDNREAWEYFRELQLAGDRLIFWGSPFDDVNWVRPDNVAGGRLATEYLINRGYKKIAFVGPIDHDIPFYFERYQGYCQALSDHELIPFYVARHPSVERASDCRECISILLNGNRPFDSVVAANNLIANGIREELADRGFLVPNQIAVVGYGCISAGETIHPPLTTVEADLNDAARRLVESIIAAPADTGRYRSKVKLVERASVGIKVGNGMSRFPPG